MIETITFLREKLKILNNISTSLFIYMASRLRLYNFGENYCTVFTRAVHFKSSFWSYQILTPDTADDYWYKWHLMYRLQNTRLRRTRAAVLSFAYERESSIFKALFLTLNHFPLTVMPFLPHRVKFKVTYISRVIFNFICL